MPSVTGSSLITGTPLQADLSTLFPDKAATEAAIARGIPETAGTHRQELRIDASGDPFFAPSGFFDASDFGAVADGSTDNVTAFTSLAAAVNAVANTDGTPVAVRFPGNGDGTSYAYSGGLTFTRPVILFGTHGASLSYSGSGYAVQLGPDTLDDTNYFFHRSYIVTDLIFRGGSSFTHGLYVADHVTDPRFVNVTFEGFGNSTGYAVYFQADNWDIRIERCKWITSSADSGVGRNWIKVNGTHATGTGHASRVAGETDYGNSHLHMFDCHASNQNGGGGAGAGMGVWVNGVNPVFIGCTLSGFEPAVRLGARSSDASFTDCYFEIIRVNAADACIEYGDPAGGELPSNIVGKLRMTKCYFNVHNTDSIGIAAYPVSYTRGNTGTGLQYSTFEQITVASLSSSRAMVNLPNRSGQIGNTARRLHGVTIVTATGASINTWTTDLNGIPTFAGSTDASFYMKLQGGVTANQNVGFQFNGYDGTSKGQLYFAPAANRFYLIHANAKNLNLDTAGNVQISGALAVNGATPAAKPTITGSRSGNAALADLITQLAAMGLLTDGTTA